MVTTIIVGVVALVIGAVAGILFTNNNVKKVQATLNYFEVELEAARERIDSLFTDYDRIKAERDVAISELEKLPATKNKTVKK